MSENPLYSLLPEEIDTIPIGPFVLRRARTLNIYWECDILCGALHLELRPPTRLPGLPNPPWHGGIADSTGTPKMTIGDYDGLENAVIALEGLLQHLVSDLRKLDSILLTPKDDHG